MEAVGIWGACLPGGRIGLAIVGTSGSANGWRSTPIIIPCYSAAAMAGCGAAVMLAPTGYREQGSRARDLAGRPAGRRATHGGLSFILFDPRRVRRVYIGTDGRGIAMATRYRRRDWRAMKVGRGP